AEINHVVDLVAEAGFQPHLTRGTERTIIAAVGSNGRRNELEALRAARGVEDVVPIAHPFKLVSRQVNPERTVVNVGGVAIGGSKAGVIGGPCSVGWGEQLLTTAHARGGAGGGLVRGGAR